MSEEHTYQQGWGEHHHHDHHHYTGPNEKNRRPGGSLRMRDKQAYYGLMFIIIVSLAFGGYKLFQMIATEIREMPKDDPTTEMDVDVLRIRKADEQDAKLYADSLAQQYNLDSMQRQVQIETRPVYRPPRKENTWYITEREWKSIFKNYRIWKRMRNKDKEEDEDE